MVNFFVKTINKFVMKVKKLDQLLTTEYIKVKNVDRLSSFINFRLVNFYNILFICVFLSRILNTTVFLSKIVIFPN